MRQSQVTEWCHSVIKSQAQTEGFYIDATMGNGKDTLFLCRLAGKDGKVLAFDIQKEALRKTKELLEREGVEKNATLVLEGHENMDRFVQKECADVICFNFGYLPGGSHAVATKVETSLRAVEKGLDVLKHGGMMSLCIYSGGDTGFAEKEALLSYVRELPSQQYTVIVQQYWNRRNHPPIPVFIFKK